MTESIQNNFRFEQSNVEYGNSEPYKENLHVHVDPEHRLESNMSPEFTVRESPLTVLMATSPHFRTLYHIFMATLLIWFFDTVIYNLLENGRINFFFSFITFGNIGRGVLLWLFELLMALMFYPAFRMYALIQKSISKHPGARRGVSIIGVAGLVVLQICLVGVPIWDINREYLAWMSSGIVTFEMFRFVMKIHAVAMACAPRCHGDGTPLPSFKHYVYFLFAPTLIYRDQYPRTAQIRWRVVLFHFSEVVAVMFFMGFLFERFICPYWSDYGKQSTVDVGTVVHGMFACALPGLVVFLCGFYCVLQAWFNAFAEMLTFGDRLFYEDWWTASSFSFYYRSWNRVVHLWLGAHIYRPLTPHIGRAFSTFIVLFLSAFAHEVIMTYTFDLFYPVLLIQFGVIGALLLPLTAIISHRFPNMSNFIICLFLLIGNAILWSLYPMEYFARKNCPPSQDDSYFKPKSWSCPEIILNPNWTFQNLVL